MIDLNRAVHIVGGDSAAGSLRAALHLSHDQVLVNEDLLSCGPTPATTDLGVWRSTRESYLRDIYVEWPDFSFGEYAENGLLMNAERLGQEQAIVVWAGQGLPDQLLLAWVVFLFDRLNLDLSKLAIVHFEKLLPTQNVLSLGEVSAENIRNYRPAPHQLNPEEAEELRRLWKVYTSDDPAILSTYVAGSSPMPTAHRAASELLYRYPDVRSGLGRWDERLLRYSLDKGPVAVRVIGYTMASMSVDWLGHVSFPPPDWHGSRKITAYLGDGQPYDDAGLRGETHLLWTRRVGGQRQQRIRKRDRRLDWRSTSERGNSCHVPLR